VALVVSWGMLERLRIVLVRDLGFTDRDAGRLAELIASYAHEGPSLTLGASALFRFLAHPFEALGWLRQEA
jgi:hypothetical protein